ncbi:MAG TPA: hypothetical protein VM422_05280 [Amaricoccus sp.]|jgi:hypothetical protein|nr:hypothetical protein [Amaricoccus sp.]
MRIAQYCLAVAASAALCGMSLGIYMAANQDFTLAPAHAHLNLLGWVSMALYGLWYRGAEIARPRLAWTQAIVATVGFAIMVVALALLLATGEHRFEALIGVGAIFTVLGMLLFLFQILTDGRAVAAGRSGPAWAVNREV